MIPDQQTTFHHRCMHGARASVARMHSKIEPSRSVDEKIKIAARDTDLTYDRQGGESFGPFLQIFTRRYVTVSAANSAETDGLPFVTLAMIEAALTENNQVFF